MKHQLPAEELAEEMELEGANELFEMMCSSFKAKFLVLASAHFNSLESESKDQFLDYCIESDNMDAYNFFHSLI